MSETKVFLPIDSTFDSDHIEVDTSQANLALVDNPEQTYIEDFTDDTDFGTYDSDLIEFSGGQMQQKDTTPSGSLIGGKFNSFDLDWSKSGSLVGTKVGDPTLVSGKLECSAVDESLYYENSAIGSCSSKLSIKFLLTPLYSGAPAINTNIFEIHNGSNNNNKIIFFHGSTGAIRITINNSSGGAVTTAYSLIGFSPVSGTEYEFVFEIDADTGDMYTYYIFSMPYTTGTEAVERTIKNLIVPKEDIVCYNDLVEYSA